MMTALALKLSAFALAMGSVAMGCSSSNGSAPDGGGGTGEGGGTLPTISISSPTAGSTVTVMTTTGSPAQKVVPITFATTLTLMAPGACGSVSTTCGHVHLLIDGTACTPSGQPYNNAATSAGPVNAILSSCPMVNGMHTVTLELHADDHSPIKDASGATISAQVAFTATGG
jgi:hypothetical protein